MTPSETTEGWSENESVLFVSPLRWSFSEWMLLRTIRYMIRRHAWQNGEGAIIINGLLCSTTYASLQDLMMSKG
jgi:hypothetical protein